MKHLALILSIFLIFSCELKKSIITFNSNEGAGEMAAITEILGSTVKLPDNQFKKENYTFLGWSTEKNSTEPNINQDKYKIEAETITLYAIWGKNPTITFDKNDGTGTIEQQIIPYNGSATLNENKFTRDNYTFLGWSTEKNATEPNINQDKYKIEAETITLYAIWGKNPTITFDKNGGTGTMDDQIISYNGFSSLNKNKFTRDNYTFLGWSINKNATTSNIQDKSNYNIGTSDVTLYAVWRIYPKIIFDANGGTGTMEQQHIPQNGSATLIQNKFTRNNYTFLGWSPDKKSNCKTYADKETFSINTADVTLYAIWESNSEILELWTYNTSRTSGWFDNNKLFEEDGNMCWIATASNLISWWRTNSKAKLSPKAGQPTIENIFPTFRRNFTDKAGHIRDAFTWYFAGKYTPYFVNDSSKLQDINTTDGAYYTNNIEAKEGTYAGKTQYYLKRKNENLNIVDLSDKFIIQNSSTLAGVSKVIIDNLKNNCGIGLTVGYDYTLSSPTYSMQMSGTHAITLWGVEYNKKTMLLTKLFVVDSDDQKYLDPKVKRIIELTCKSSEEYPGKRLEIYNDDSETGGGYVSSDNWYICQVCVLNLYN